MDPKTKEKIRRRMRANIWKTPDFLLVSASLLGFLLCIALPFAMMHVSQVSLLGGGTTGTEVHHIAGYKVVVFYLASAITGLFLALYYYRPNRITISLSIASFPLLLVGMILNLSLISIQYGILNKVDISFGPGAYVFVVCEITGLTGAIMYLLRYNKVRRKVLRPAPKNDTHF